MQVYYEAMGHMTHRKYGRSRQRIHRGMARHPGKRKSWLDRLEQSAKDKKHSKPEIIIEKKRSIKKRRGFIGRLFK